jgi:hypothetical protein
MNHRIWLSPLVATCVICFGIYEASAQTALQRTDPLLDDPAVVRAAISEQKVLRQTEVIRLERLIDQLQTRMMRLERQSFASTRFPAITVTEAEAALEYAEAQLQESERLTEQGEATKTRIASDQLAVARARGQLLVANAAHTENLIVLELDVIDAQRRCIEESQRMVQLERLVAKGYASADGLQLRKLDFDRAKKELQLARLRLETQQQASSDAEPTLESK